MTTMTFDPYTTESYTPPILNTAADVEALCDEIESLKEVVSELTRAQNEASKIKSAAQAALGQRLRALELKGRELGLTSAQLHRMSPSDWANLLNRETLY